MEKKIERFDKYMKTKGLNDNKVTNSLGLSIGTLGKSRKENRDLSERNIEKILNFYTDLNRTWLLTGEGSMFTTEPSLAGFNEMEFTRVPLLPISAQGGSLNDFVVSVSLQDCEKIISPINGADIAITISGDSMADEYPNGSIVLAKRINERAFIDWGKVYVLDTCNGVVVKTLTPSEKEDCIRCVSINPDPIYAPFEVALNDIYGVYRVMLCMAKK
ncbi:MAG: helix-turn-helix transcriptional regulator [Prevotella pallens]|uniref:S24 family peptidase n=1 Tax=Prevotella pallens TaxID=60133 RepID=UPI001CAD70AA|nr:S24 family peptidase [Prevotella pallens]MBF1490683.1 helix-turn-helix transcriptional regulator [Prevotella pallens]